MTTQVGDWIVNSKWDSEGEECVLLVQDGEEPLFYILRDDVPELIMAMLGELSESDQDVVYRYLARRDC